MADDIYSQIHKATKNVVTYAVRICCVSHPARCVVTITAEKPQRVFVFVKGTVPVCAHVRSDELVESAMVRALDVIIQRLPSALGWQAGLELAAAVRRSCAAACENTADWHAPVNSMLLDIERIY